MSSIVIASLTASVRSSRRPALRPAAGSVAPGVHQPRIVSTKRIPIGGASGPVGSNGMPCASRYARVSRTPMSTIRLMSPAEKNSR